MAIYTYKCPDCGLVEEKLVKKITEEVFHFTCPNAQYNYFPTMEIVPSVPSPPQWNCKRF